MAPAARPNDIVIVGGGIIGLCTAYYLLTSPALPTNSTVTLVESSTRGVAQCASKSAGGFISKYWHDDAVLSLASLTWDCHRELASKFNGRENWGWRECGAVGLTVDSAEGSKGEEVSRSAYRNLPAGTVEDRDAADWLKGVREDMSGSGGIGQLDPAQFCAFLYAHCQSLGLRTIFAVPLASTSTSLTLRPLSSPRSIMSVRYDTLVITAGPWSAALCRTLGLSDDLPITNLPGHSILVRPAPVTTSANSELPSAAIFAGLSGADKGVHASTSGIAKMLSVQERSGGFTASPELFPRLNGLVYIAGENSIPATGLASTRSRRSGEREEINRLPLDGDGVEALLDEELIARLVKSAAAVSDRLDITKGAVIEKKQFCYRPITADGAPIVGKLRESVYVACGHGPWGITLAPGTGKIMSELILEPEREIKSADISQLGLQRFTPRVTSRL